MYCQLSDLKQQKFTGSQFWRLEIWNQGVSRTMLPVKPVGENPGLPFLASSVHWESLASRCITWVSPSIFTWPYSPVCLCLFPWHSRCLSSYKDPTYIGLGPSFFQYNLIFNYISKDATSKYDLPFQILGLGLQPIFWRGLNSTHNTLRFTI